MTPDFESEARLLHAVADAVAEVVRSSPAEEFAREIGMGADGTPTKHVDKLAEDEVVRVVEATEHPRVNVVSEELGLLDRGGDLTLVVDPVDGTSNAARGLPMYCIALALGRKRLSDVHHTLVRNLPTGDSFVARRGEGAFKNGTPIRVRPRTDGEAMISADLGALTNPAPLLRMAQKYIVRSLGSAALEMCFVAEGGLDLYYMSEEKLRVTDVAASTLLVREAGGIVWNGQGEELDMELSLEPRTSVVAAADKSALDLVEGFQ